jgi:DNA polymerase III delta prime subunit
MSDEFLWTEKYRPKTISECVLPDRIKKSFQEYVNTGSIPNLMLTGGPGVGKTTAAIAMCKEIGLNYILINSSDENGVATIRTKVNGYASTISLTGGRKVIIFDEADYLTPEAQATLRGAIEEFSDNCSFIFTCNFKSRLIDALHSRCSVIDFTLNADEKPRMASHFYTRLMVILNNEGVTYDRQVLIKLVEKFFPDYRRALNELQRYSSGGAIDAGTLAQVSDVRKFIELIGYLKGRNFTEMRKWVVSNSDIDSARIYRKIYDSLYEYFKPDSIPQAVIIIARYQYQSAFVADQEINLVACLTEMMVDCECQ